MLIHYESMSPKNIGDQTLEHVIKCTYQRSVIAVDGGTEEDVKSRIGKARTTCNILNKI